MSSPKVLTAVMMASVKDEVLVQYDKKISGDDKEGLYDTAQQVQHALDSQDINLRVDSFRWETSGLKTPSPYIVLRGKQQELIKLFSLRSLISLTLKKFRIHNPRREINGFTIQYRASDNDTTVEDMYAKIAQSCPYLVVKDKTSAVRVIWVVKDVEAGKSAVETSYSDLNLVFDKSDSISISPPNPDATHVQPVPTAATSTGLSAAMVKTRVRDRSNDTVIPPSAKRKTKKPVGTTVSEDEVESPALFKDGIGDPAFFEDEIEYPAVACFDSVRNEAISVTSKRMKARLRKLDMPLPEEVQADKQKTRRVCEEVLQYLEKKIGLFEVVGVEWRTEPHPLDRPGAPYNSAWPHMVLQGHREAKQRALAMANLLEVDVSMDPAVYYCISVAIHPREECLLFDWRTDIIEDLSGLQYLPYSIDECSIDEGKGGQRDGLVARYMYH